MGLDFFFISLTTIGLGDVVPDHPGYMVMTFGFVIVGLSLVSMSINVVQQKLEELYLQLLLMLLKVRTSTVHSRPRFHKEQGMTQEYQTQMASGDNQVNATMGMMQSWANNPKAKFLMPLLRFAFMGVVVPVRVEFPSFQREQKADDDGGVAQGGEGPGHQRPAHLQQHRQGDGHARHPPRRRRRHRALSRHPRERRLRCHQGPLSSPLPLPSHSRSWPWQEADLEAELEEVEEAPPKVQVFCYETDTQTEAIPLHDSAAQTTEAEERKEEFAQTSWSQVPTLLSLHECLHSSWGCDGIDGVGWVWGEACGLLR